MANAVVVSTANASMDDEPLWEQAAGGDAAINYTATNDRTLFDALFVAEGPLGASSFQVTQRAAGANYTVDVSAGSAIITGDSVAGQGKYLIRSQGAVNIPYAGGAPGSGTRIHRIIARIRDKPSDGGTTYDWTLEWLEDTGTGTPALPASAITLALVTIAAGQASVLNANISDQRVYADPYTGGPAWVDFSSAALINVTGGTFSKGNSTYSARYRQNGRTVHYAFKITVGSTLGAGAGTWQILLPVTANANLLGAGALYINDSGTALRVGTLIMVDATHLVMVIYNITGIDVDSNGPGTAWAAGDQIIGSITYEAA